MIAGFLVHGGGVICRPCALQRKTVDLEQVVPSDGAEGIRCSRCQLPLAIATPPVDAAAKRG